MAHTTPRRGRAPLVALAAIVLAVALVAVVAVVRSRDVALPGVVAGPPRVWADTECTLGPAQVTGRGVGSIRLGMDAAELRERCGARDTALTLGEGLTERGLALRVLKARAVALTDSANAVARVVVTSRGPTTGGGVGVGSRLASVRARHGRMCAFVGEGRIVAVASRLPGVSFVTDASYARFATDSQALADADLPAATRVTEILVHGDSVPCPEDP
jgi:hypothetical protein